MLNRAKDVIYRPYHESDRDDIVSLIAKMWYPHVSDDLARQHGNFELDWHLAHQDHTVVARLDNKFAGLIFSRSPKLEHATDFAGDFNKLISKYPEDHPMITGINWLRDEVHAVESVKKTHPNVGTGWLELLMVSPEIRGIGLGKTLYKLGIENLANSGATHYRLLTDDDCDWTFYEHDKMTRLGAFPDKDNFNVYIYEKKID